MFKVPDWGNDIPKSDVEVAKLFTKKNRKSNSQRKTKDNAINIKINHKKNNVNINKKAKNYMNGQAKLSKDEHIKNRILRKNLKVTSTATKNNHKMETNIVTKQANKFHHNTNVNNKANNIMLIRKGKKLSSKIDKDGVKKSNKNNNGENKEGFEDIKNFDQKSQSHKRKQSLIYKRCEDIEVNNADVQSLITDEPDKILINAKRKKLNDKINNDDIDHVLFGNKDSEQGEEFNKEDVISSSKINKTQKKKEKLKEILKRDSNRNIIRTSSNKLRERMLERLKAAQFRYLNEKLYTTSGSESQELFKSDPAAFQTYHEGYQLQVKKWPVNPLDLIVKRIQKMSKTHLIADMGCGEATLSKRVIQSVRSFDLVATTPEVEACNMAHTPLLAASMDVVVFCLALMGTDLTQYLLEANRVLKTGGHLLIAEVESRFENVDSFSSEVQRLGFSLKKLDKSHQVFFFMEFNKTRDAPTKRGRLPTLSLKPCLYKRR